MYNIGHRYKGCQFQRFTNEPTQTMFWATKSNAFGSEWTEKRMQHFVCIIPPFLYCDIRWLLIWQPHFESHIDTMYLLITKALVVWNVNEWKDFDGTLT